MNTITRNSARKMIRSAALLLSLALLLAGHRADAANVWNGGGGDGSWTNPLNWDSISFPGPLTFSGSTGLANTNDNGSTVTVNSMLFTNGGGFTIGGNAITLAGNITNQTTSLQTINLNMNLGTAVRTVLLTTGGGDVVLGGNLSGSGFTLAGAGKLTLSGNNSCASNTTFAANQTININSATALGSGALVAGGNGSFDNTSGAPITSTNNFNLSGGSPTFVGTTNLTINGVTTVSGGNRTLTTTNTLTLAKIDADTTARTFTKAGPGTLAITGGAGANFQGGFTLSAGKLILATNAAIGTGPFTFAFGTATLTAGADLSGPNKISNAVTIISLPAIISGTNNIEFGGKMTGNRSGNPTVSNSLDSSKVFTLNDVELSLNSAAVRTLVFASAGADTIIKGVIANGNAVKTNILSIGPGRTIITGTGHTYAGPTLITGGGILQITNVNNLGTGPLQFGQVATTTGTLALRADGDATFAKDAVHNPTDTKISGVARFDVDRASAGGPLNGVITWGLGSSNMLMNSDNGGLLLTGTNGYGLTLNQSIAWPGQNPNFITHIVNNAPGWLTILGDVSCTPATSAGGFGVDGTGNIQFSGNLFLTNSANQLKNTNWVGGTFLNKLGTNTLKIAGNFVFQSTQPKVALVTDGKLVLAGSGNSYQYSVLTNSLVPVDTGLVPLILVNGGQLVVANSLAVAGAGLALPNNDSVTFTNGTTFQVAGLVGTGNVALTNTAGSAIQLQIGNNLANTVGESVDGYNNSANPTYDGVLSGPGSLVKIGTNTQTLAGANTYTGNTTVSNGTLVIAVDSIATNSTVTVAGGAVLQLDFATTNVVAGLVTNGVSLSAGVYSSNNVAPFITGPGSLQVVPIGPVYPPVTLLTNSFSGGTLSLSWPTNQGWRLQQQTNALSKGLSTNWVYVTDGSVSSTNITVNPAQPAVFYRLTYP